MTNNLTKNNIKRIKSESDSKLVAYVCDYILDNYSNYNKKESIFTDVLNYGCQSGVVGSLIYYCDTVAFYDEHKEEINNLLYEIMFEYGTTNPKDLFGDKWDDEDPLCIDTYNKNLMAWFGFEETMRNIGRNFKSLEDLI